MAENRKGSSLIDIIIKRSDILVAVGIILILGVMIIPLPSYVLDLLLSFSITLALVVLLVTLYTHEPLELSVFPGLLLVLTLYRLALNVASTRLILLEAEPGKVISAFGEFVVGGNYVVGLIIFIILVVIQFIVITKGAGRIAEVSARFTLDAMPGKQMAIDADLNAGLIDEEAARTRRAVISREADFYGAMDGASKFVRGDAIAGIIITLINILGGFIIGMAQRGLSIGEALETYTILTVGDGLVSQIPALLISTAAGIIISRAASDSNLGTDMVTQLFAQPKAILIAAFLLAALGIIPGLPTMPFLMMAGVSGSVGLLLVQSKSRSAQEEKDAKTAREEDSRKNEEASRESADAVLADLLRVERMELEIGYGLIPLVDRSQKGDLLDRINLIRKQVASELGLLVPLIRIRDNIQLKPSQYRIKIRGDEVASGEMVMNHFMALDPGLAKTSIEGIPTREPVFGLEAVWVHHKNRERAERLGYTVIEPAAVLATHITEIIKNNAAELLTRQDVKDLVENMQQDNPALVEELIPAHLTYGSLQRILQHLLQEKVPIRNLQTILETVSESVSLSSDIEFISEMVRRSLSRSIIGPLTSDDGSLEVITLSPELEQTLAGAIKEVQGGRAIVLEPEVSAGIVKNIAEAIEKLIREQRAPVILTSPATRLYLWKLLSPMVPNLAVISYSEIPPNISVNSQKMVKV